MGAGDRSRVRARASRQGRGSGTLQSRFDHILCIRYVVPSRLSDALRALYFSVGSASVRAMTRHGVEPRICLDCGRDDLAREGEDVERCPDCGGPVR
jgi:hypothetical protein